MRKRQLNIQTLLVFSLLLLPVWSVHPVSTPAQNRVGEVDRIEKPPTGAEEFGRREVVRSVEVYRQGGLRDPAYKEMPLNSGDEINVRRGDPRIHRVIIGFDDPTLKVLKLGPGSLVRLTDQESVESESGLLAWFVGKLRATTKYVQAIAPGTQYGIAVDGERSRVFVWEGEVEVTNLGPTPRTVSVREKQLTEAAGPGQPSQPRVPRFEEVKDLVLFGLDLDPVIRGSVTDQNLQQQLHEDYWRAQFESRAQPTAVAPQINLGNVNLFLGKYNEALEAFEIAERISARPSAIYNGRGIALTQLRQFDPAIESFNQAISRDDESMFHNNLANLYLQQGQIDQALDEYDRAVERDQSNAAPYNGRGVAFIAQDQLATAANALHASIRLKDRATPHTNLGNLYLLQNEPATAHAEYERAIQLDPRDAAALNNQGVAHLKQRQFDQALNAFNRAIEADPRGQSPRIGLGLAQVGLKQFDEAASAFMDALALDPTNRTTYRNLAFLFLTEPSVRSFIESQLNETAASQARFKPAIDRFLEFLPRLPSLPGEEFEAAFEAFQLPASAGR